MAASKDLFERAVELMYDQSRDNKDLLALAEGLDTNQEDLDMLNRLQTVCSFFHPSTWKVDIKRVKRIHKIP